MCFVCEEVRAFIAGDWETGAEEGHDVSCPYNNKRTAKIGCATINANRRDYHKPGKSDATRTRQLVTKSWIGPRLAKR